MDASTVIVLVAVFGGWAIKSAPNIRCPKCHKWTALEKTGETDARNAEWKCKYCDDLLWRPVPKRGFGGGFGGGNGGDNGGG